MLTIIKTSDGSNTIYNSEVGENYHSKHGALQESRHVFIKSGLLHFFIMQALSKPPAAMDTAEVIKGSQILDEEDLQGGKVSILEVGFGTGLNFLLSASLCTEKKIHLDFTGIEAFPLNLDMISQTNYKQYIENGIWQKFIGNYQKAFLAEAELNSYCKLKIAHCELLNFYSGLQYDIIYFDAFAVARQPEMWDTTAIAHTLQFLKPGGIFVTYAITGNLKRTLKMLDCKVEKLPGAPGKREMLRAVKAAI